MTTRSAVERSAVDEKYKWKLDKMFPDWEAWERAFAEIEEALPELAARRDSLARSAGDLLATIEAIHAVQRKLEVVAIYAGMKSDEDTRIGENTARKGRSSSLAVRFSESISWFDAELLAMEPALLGAFLDENEPLRLYAHFIDDIQRARAHTLAPEQEALLAAVGNLTRGASQVFGALNNADMKYPSIRPWSRAFIRMRRWTILWRTLSNCPGATWPRKWSIVSGCGISSWQHSERRLRLSRASGLSNSNPTRRLDPSFSKNIMNPIHDKNFLS